MKTNKKAICRLLAFGLNMGMICGGCENILLLCGYESGSLCFTYLEYVNKAAHILFLAFMSFFLVMGKHIVCFITIGIGWMCLFLISLYISPQISTIFLKSLFYTIRNVIVVSFAFAEVRDFKEFEKNLTPYIYIGAIYSFTQIGVFIITKDYSMNYSYSSIIVGILCMLLAFRQKKLRFYLLTSLFLLTNLICGARGALICYTVAVILYMTICFKQRNKFFSMIFLGILSIIFVFVFEDLFQWIYRLFPDSRTIRLFAEGKAFSLSNRNTYYNLVINRIKESPLIINGLYSDRSYIANCFGRKETADIFGSYAHNFFLEVLFQFGIWGVSIFLILMFTIIYSIKIIKEKHSQSLSIIFIIFLSYCFGRLLLSGSYLTDISFGGLTGIMLSLFLQERSVNKWKK